MEISMFQKFEEVDLLHWKLVEASVEVHGSFCCRWKWKLRLLPSIAASTNVFRRIFHELPYTPTYFHLLPRVAQSSSCFRKTDLSRNSNPNPNPHPRATSVEAGLLPTIMEVHGSTWKLMEEGGSWNGNI